MRIEDLRRLAAAGNTRAQYHLGVELLKGERTPQDRVKGYTWLEIAADCGPVCSTAEASSFAAEARLQLQRMLSGPELLQAERDAESYLAPQLAAYRESAAHVEQALLGRSGQGVELRSGCAVAPTLEGCAVESYRLPGRPSCRDIAQKPDRPAAERGPDARIRTPRYPSGAADDVAEGRVVVGTHVDYTGYVCAAGIVHSSGNAAIDRAALDSLLTWRFQPAILGGEPVDALFNMTIDFSVVDVGEP